MSGNRGSCQDYAFIVTCEFRIAQNIRLIGNYHRVNILIRTIGSQHQRIYKCQQAGFGIYSQARHCQNIVDGIVAIDYPYDF
ncbi:hypothetical protein GKZ86_00275 [Flavobacterium sp. LC2016-13]|nr:hypothetical protein [Flavobacterium sp. LC2016-13]